MLSHKNIFQAVHPFTVEASYIELDSHSPENVFDAHIHNECEIYINISGDVSFVVENSIYPITPGSIIITRPFEYHHCVYHSDKLHKHFWILFSTAGNEYLFDKFFNRKAGEHNHLILDKDNTEELLTLCKKMANGIDSEFEKYCGFFKIMNLIHDADTPDRTVPSYPDIITNAIAYINDNLSYPIRVDELSQAVNVSVNTLERYFMRFLHVSPTAYIKKRRLAYAAKLLSEGYSVTEASENSGFSSCSGFISLFRKTYGQTPYTYKKSVILHEKITHQKSE